MNWGYQSPFSSMHYTLNFATLKRTSSTVASRLRAIHGKQCAQWGEHGAWVSWLSRYLLHSSALRWTSVSICWRLSYLCVHPYTHLSAVSEGCSCQCNCGLWVSSELPGEAVAGGHGPFCSLVKAGAWEALCWGSGNSRSLLG